MTVGMEHQGLGKFYKAGGGGGLDLVESGSSGCVAHIRPRAEGCLVAWMNASRKGVTG